MVLVKMKETAEAYLGKKVTHAVVTVPAVSFNAHLTNSLVLTLTLKACRARCYLIRQFHVSPNQCDQVARLFFNICSIVSRMVNNVYQIGL